MQNKRDPKLDEKFYGVLVKSKDNTVVSPDQYMIFLAKDNAFPDTLAFYRNKCLELGAGPAQILAIDEMIMKVKAWRENHPELCKIADVDPGELP